MAQFLETASKLGSILWSSIRAAPTGLLLLAFVTIVVGLLSILYTALFILAPVPRPVQASEKTYITTTPSGSTSQPIPLPSWHDRWVERRKKAAQAGDFSDKEAGDIEDAELAMSVVIPAYNEEERLEIMLEEAIAYLDETYGRDGCTEQKKGVLNEKSNGHTTGKLPAQKGARQRVSNLSKSQSANPTGYEILLVNDGSKDKTVEVALRISQKHGLHDILRIITLKKNRGKGGAVTHGFRHVRGAYAIFADADGASKFSDLGSLVKGCEEVHDGTLRGVAVGSRAHMVGSEAVIKRSAVRNALMHAFHLLLRLLTPPATSQIKDTQCGFKLFSRASLPYIIPYMHAEGWIFDVEMLMLAESAPILQSDSTSSDDSDDDTASEKARGNAGIKVKEVPIGWREVGGSKLNVMWDSLGMAWGLALLRLSWGMGVYKRR